MKPLYKPRNVLVAIALLSAFVLTGCGSKDVPVNVDEELKMRDDRITQLEEEARQNEVKLEMTRREADEAAERAADAQKLADSSAASGIDVNSYEGDLMPPNAKAGECFARVLVPPVFENSSERVMVKEASSSISINPAKFEWVEEQILIREAGERLVVIPATYKTVEEKILVKPTSSHIVEVPAVYETVTEKVLVTPEREYWKKGRGPIEKVDGSTGEIMCLVKEEAVYNTVSKKVLKSEATTREEDIPAEYETITTTVLDTPPATRTEVIPAEYGTIKVRKLVTPASEVRTPIEEEYRTVNKKIMVDPSYMEWRQILCETNMNQATVLDIQRALKGAGFDPVQLDGIYGRNTQAAVTAFQKSKSLASGSLTYETITALGLGN